MTAGSSSLDRSEIESALAQRLRAVCGVLLEGSAPAPHEDPLQDASVVLDRLVGAVQETPSHDRVWLLYVAVAGVFPVPDEVLEATRLFRLLPTLDLTLWLLDRAHETDVPEAATHRIEVVTDQVIVDVDHSARHDLHTGIQQVVRRTLPRWARDHEIVPTAWTSLGRALRTLTDVEKRRALRWAGRQEPQGSQPSSPSSVVVPWRTVVVLAETPGREACERLEALAQWSGNTVVAIGYDCIPVVSADLVPAVEPNRFGRYLAVLKHARRIAGISETATVEFQGFANALPSQGLRGPIVVECALPAESIAVSDESRGRAPRVGTAAVPLVLAVGSLEPRKNHLAILHAAELLWREGRDFELLFIGGSGWGEEVPGRIAELRKAGRLVSSRKGASDEELAAAYQAARFTVFASLHEGYGLPVAESLSAGTPVITSNYGSTKEIAAHGGAVLVDPRDDQELLEAMRSLLSDDARLRALREEIARRPERTWEQYAAELWDTLVLPELSRAPVGRGA